MAALGQNEGKAPVTTAKALEKEFLPRHVAIIMDGNGRWAQKRGMPRTFGHKAGVEALREIIKYSDELGVEALTVYAFSAENWKRSTEEVGALMRLLLQYFTSEIDELNEKNVRIRILGDIDGMPGGLEKQKDALHAAIRRTHGNTGLQLNIALNYGGQQEIIRAAQKLAEHVANGDMKPEDIDRIRNQQKADAAREALLQKQSRREYLETQAQLARALTRLRVKHHSENLD